MVRFMGRMVAAVALIVSAPVGSAPKSGDPAARNKAVVLAYLDTMIAKGRVQEAMDRYVADGYIQHNPKMPTGKAASTKAFIALAASMKGLKIEVKRAVAEGDMVAVHSKGTRYPGDRGVAVMDFYRLENGLIVEHWDVIQDVPESAANGNGMF